MADDRSGTRLGGCQLDRLLGGTAGIHRDDPETEEVAMIIEKEGPTAQAFRVTDHGRICIASPTDERNGWIARRTDTSEVTRFGDVGDADVEDRKASK